MLEQRYYTCETVTRTVLQWNRAHTAQREQEVTQPEILFEEGIEPGTALIQMSTGEAYLVAATPEWWAAFDARNPNQDAQTGAPYRRRYPRKDLPFLDFQP